MIETKICTNPECTHGGRPQPLSNYHRDVARCKDCRNKWQKENRLRNREKMNADARERYRRNARIMGKEKRQPLEKWHDCLCPRCGKTHKVKLFWTGKGQPRKFCLKCGLIANRMETEAVAHVPIW